MDRPKLTPSARPERAQLLAVLARGPVSWRELKNRFPGEVRALRQLLRGLEHNGEISRTAHGGQYVLAGDPTETITGMLDRRDRLLYLQTDEGALPVTDEARTLRPGDSVRALRDAGTGGGVRVIEVLAYSPAPLVGYLVAGRGGWRVESLSPDYRGPVEVDDVLEGLGPGDTVALVVTGESRGALVGRIVNVVARQAEGTAALAAETLLAAHDVPVEWPGDLAPALGRLPETVDPAAHAVRAQLEALPLVTIDGQDARDFDDAVFCEPAANGGWRLVVAIADVAHYVEPDSELDRHARTRGNSTYLPDRVVPMLPEVLSNGLCSLRPEEHRLALVCDLRLTATGEIAGFEFSEAVMCSWRRLTYTQVAAFLDGLSLDVPEPVRDSLHALHGAYGALRQARDERGGLDFDSQEVGVMLESGEVTGIHLAERNDAHRMIEEAMIAANVCAARHLEAAGLASLYRIHEPPTGDKLDQLRQAFAIAGLRWSSGQLTARALKRAMAALADRRNRRLYEMLVLRAMQQARYSPENAGHFGLALPRYMHFTSPIRRYADLVVHRAIKRSLGGPQPTPDMDWLLQCGEHISMTERRSEEVERGVLGWLKCESLRGREGEVFEGTVVGVADFGLFVELADVYVQGLVHVSDLGEDYFRFFAETLTLVGDRNGRRFGFGDPLEVVLTGIRPERGQVDLVPAGGGTAGRRRRPSARRRKRR